MYPWKILRLKCGQIGCCLQVILDLEDVELRYMPHDTPSDPTAQSFSVLK